MAETIGNAGGVSERAILQVKNLTIEYPINIGTVRAVRDVSFDLRSGETLGLVGESGCGKSTLGLSLLRLLRPPGRVATGEILFRGRDIVKMSAAELLTVRGNQISMVFQNPLTSLDPLFRVRDHFYETLRTHRDDIGRAEAMELAGNILEQLGIERKRLDEYPHQLSGGMRQRIMIGLGLVLDPDILIADEPTTSLDVIVEAGFVDLLKELGRRYGISIILISHNLAMVAEIADRIAVMYGGRIAEIGDADAIFGRPLHPYTQGLIGCVPNIELDMERLVSMPGSPPDLVSPPPGCPFAPRCPKVMEVCRVAQPPLRAYVGEQQTACWLHESAEQRAKAEQSALQAAGTPEGGTRDE